MRLATTLVVLMSCAAPTVLAGDVATPSGINVETRPSGGQVVLDLGGGALLTKGGGFGPNVFRTLHPDGSLTLFATGVGSYTGSDLGPGGVVVLGDFVGPTLWACADANADGDALDAGEMLALDVDLDLGPAGAVLSPYDLAFAPGTDDLYVTASSGSSTFVVVIEDALEPAPTAAVFWEDTGFPGGLAFWDGGLYVAVVGLFPEPSRVVRLADDDADGDALDEGEAQVFADGLGGANYLAAADDGTFYLSGTFDPLGSGASVTRLAADGPDADVLSDAVDEGWSSGYLGPDLPSFPFTGELVLIEGPGGFVPGADGDGVLYVADATLLSGTFILRTAPLAATALTGVVANDGSVDVVVTGAPLATGVVMVSLDVAGTTLAGVGDLCVGFDAPHLITTPFPLDGTGEGSFTLTLHGVPSLVGLDLAIQGFTLEGAAVGIGDGFVEEVAP